ncbi:gastric triacylglycerol lipase-like, partial [Aplysia californica]|uniref:Gastric triacylglycerol lipase-like n=1 Tax=Aplysia californica TaxID=6500 RepID=A0ABM0ZWT6_APLCA
NLYHIFSKHRWNVCDCSGLVFCPTDVRPVVLLQHGLCGASTDYLVSPANQSLAFLLADAGADVWLGNMRGNSYSKQHKHLSPSHSDFWRWSFDEMARYDIPAMIDYVLKVTNRKQLFYVGHSQGCSTMLIHGSRDKYITSKVRHFYALSPAARLQQTTGFTQKIVKIREIFKTFFNGVFHGSTDVGLFTNIAIVEIICKTEGLAFCRDKLFKMFGDDVRAFNTVRSFILITVRLSAGLGTVKNGVFENYDEGSPEANRKRYGQPTPPAYDLKGFQLPISVYYGGSDVLVAPGDVEWLLTQIKAEYVQRIGHYNHIDFVWAMDAPDTIYSHLIKHMFHLERLSPQ